ncbi:ParA family protein [Streptomyces sp. NPDC057067]|uniref:ParA family protein n=1 Tax=unclassified Streptomyces TaxID=2593676 RepID=UPI00363E2930
MPSALNERQHVKAYALWNNKGGVGKSFLCFVAACQYAETFPDADVYVIDLCPQANVSETLLGGYQPTSPPIREITAKKPRATIAGYLEARLNSPFQMIDSIEPFITHPRDYNVKIPENLYLSCGDSLLELLSEAIRQTSQLTIPFNAWRQVIEWVRDLCESLSARSGDRDAVIFIDCNPSFAIYTQQALVAADNLVVPFTADDSSRRAIENVMALLYGVSTGEDITQYARINFSQRAISEGIHTPKLHTFVSNRVTTYKKAPSKAFQAVRNSIEATLNGIYKKHRTYFVSSRSPGESFVDVPDYHSACIVSAVTGTPVHSLKAGPHLVNGERIQINLDPLKSYKTALSEFVERL